MKKALAMLLCSIMSLSLLAGCGGGDGKGNGTDGEDGKITLTIGLPQQTMVEDYNTNAWTRWLEEETGYNIEFQLFASSTTDYKSQLATMVAGGEKLPDILWNMQLGSSTYRQYGREGYLLELTSYFKDETYSGEWWSRIEELYPEIFQEYVKSALAEKDDGRIWAVPRIECTEVDTMNYQMWINQTWLDNLGLDMPTDTESLYNVLKAFVNNDPNGNGQKDEIGLVGRHDNYYNNVTGWIHNLFVNESNDYWWNVGEDGQIWLPYTTDEYRESLIFMNKLVSEKLMPETVFAMTNSNLSSLLNPADGVNTVGIFCAHPTVLFNEGQESLYEYVPLPTWGYAVRTMNAFEKKTFITTDCENPDAAWNLLMTMCSEEGSTRLRYGEYGVDWTDADEGAKSFLNRDAKIKVLNDSVWGQGNQTWVAVGSAIIIDAEQETRQVDEAMSDWGKWKMQMLKETYEAYTASAAAKPEVRIPYIIYGETESELTEVERQNCQDLIKTYEAQFACGTNGKDPSSDKDWQTYLSELEKNGLATWQEQVQRLYDEAK